MEQHTSTPDERSRPGETIGLAHPVTWILGLYLVTLVVVLSYVLLRLWPSLAGDVKPVEGTASTVLIFGIPIVGSVQVIALAMVMGGLGSYLHVARSFIVYVGNGQLTGRWFWWYLLSPFLGMALAVIVSLVVQAGFLPVGGSGGRVNPYGIAAVSALVGMFAKPATEKLREVFDTMFSVSQPTPFGDKLAGRTLNPRPGRIAIKPNEIEPWSGPKTVTVTGLGFIESSEVLVHGAARRTEFVSPSQLRVHLLPEDTVSEGALSLQVRNPPSGGGHSEAVMLNVRKKDETGGSELGG